MSVAIGEISYTNIIPAFYCMDREKLKAEGCRFYPEVPAGLNKGMQEGTIDVAGISSFAFGAGNNELQLMPDLSVSSFGKVGSILLFSEKPIDQLEGSSVALTSSSATSVHLLKIILAEFYGFQEITYQTMEPDPVQMKIHHDAFLLIGDDAIRASWNTSETWHCYDLGEQWYKHTGLPMTYAVFAVRKETAALHPALVKNIYKEFLCSKVLSLQTYFHMMAEEVAARYGGTASFWEDYFHGLHYDFRKKEKAGLLYYFELLYKYNFLRTPVENINMWLAGNEVQFLS